MPAVPASVNDKFQVSVVGRLDGQETRNVFHFMAANAVDDVELRLILVLIACFREHLLPGLSNQWHLERVIWKMVNPTLGVEHVTVPDPAASGEITGDWYPSFTSILISIRSAFGGRSKRGRMYLAGIPEQGAQGSELQTAELTWTSVLAFAACLAEKFLQGDLPAINTFQFQIYSRKLGGSTFPYGNAGFTAASAFNPVQQISTTRSRKVGRGS
jgi:hypothetical protein